MTLIERVRTQEQEQGAATAVTSPASGWLMAWRVRRGQRVTVQQEIAVVRVGDDEVIITAPVGGVVDKLLAEVTDEVQQGQPVCSLAPDTPTPPQRSKTGYNGAGAESAPHQGQGAPTQQRPAGEATRPKSEDAPTRATNGRRGPAHLEVEELAAPTMPELLPAPVPLARPKKTKVIRRSVRCTEGQAQDFDGLLDRLHAAGYDFTRAELERTLFALLLGQPFGEVVKLAAANRDKELSEGYGVAWPTKAPARRVKR